jgi:hypothetical protein
MSEAVTRKKERGCFQCSRRRVVCDRTEPSCLKCAKKGIGCSGLSRIRFAEGVARRGRLKGCRIPKTKGDGGCQELPTITRFQAALVWLGEDRATKRKCDVNGSTDTKDPTKPTSHAQQEPANDGYPRVPSLELTTTDKEGNTRVEDICRRDDSLVTANSRHYNVVPWIAPVVPTLRMLFSYCMLMVILDQVSDIAH